MTNLISIVRRKKNIKQRDLAVALAVSPSYLCKIENGVQIPTEKFIEACSGFLETPKDELFPNGQNGNRRLKIKDVFDNGLWSARMNRGIKQNELARQLGCSPSYLSKIEQSKLQAKPLFKKKCAKILKVKEAELFPAG